MNKYTLVAVVVFFIFSCAKEKKNMIITGNVTGLKKGKLYLQKIKDTLIVNVDSIVLDGSNFTLADNLESPEIYFLSLSGTDKILQFFGEEGKINIETDINTFNYKAEITGSSNQDLLNVFNENMRKFNNLKLDLIKEKFDAVKDKESEIQIIAIEKKINNITKRELRYTLNFAFNNVNSEISPYLTLSELYKLDTYYLDTIANSLSEKVKASKYGKKLIAYIAKVKG
ncbi:MAG: DUF4369 domain-containing protein [Flavobacteriaceae bacterium]|nr:DUF4369 domain-containing protein [Flavobacteriaceae bacterium]